MLSRWCVCIILLVHILRMTTPQEDSFVYTSPVLKRNKTNYLEFAGKTYYVGTVFKANFHRAMQFCRQLGMQLVSINSKLENDKVGQFAADKGTNFAHFWTSGTNLADESQWVWLSTGNNIVYTNWYPGEPSGISSVTNKTERCLEQRHFGKDYHWNDKSCFDELFFICETTESCCK